MVEKICVECNELSKHKALGLCYKCYYRRNSRLMYERHRENRIKDQKEIYKNNKELKLKYNKERYNLGFDAARKRSLIKNQRQQECLFCKLKEHLEFHHTNYELDKGFTLCRSCHRKEHRIKTRCF